MSKGRLMLTKVCFVSVSGGKDSTLTLALAIEKYKETGVPVIAVFCDTNWEHPLTYEYLNYLEDFFQIRIHRISALEGGLPSLIRKKRIFPSPRRRFCTQILKVKTFRNFCLQVYFSFPFRRAEVWQGIRKEESRARRKTKDYVLEAGEKTKFGEVFPFDLHYVYPIKNLTKQEVFRELKKRGIDINPLYKQGLDRVGCYPCFLSKKDIIQVIVKALEGDKFAVKQLERMKKLDSLIPSRFNIDFTLEELIEKAKRQFRLKEKLLELPFPANRGK